MRLKTHPRVRAVRIEVGFESWLVSRLIQKLVVGLSIFDTIGGRFCGRSVRAEYASLVMKGKRRSRMQGREATGKTPIYTGTRRFAT